MTTINIHASVATNSVPYFEYMKQNYERTATSHPLKWFTHCIDSASHEALKNKVDGAFLTAGGTGATAHGNTIKSALVLSRQTEGIDIVADTDTVMLMKGWDAITAEILKDVGVFGTTFEKIGGFCSGDGRVQMYKDIPTFTWFAMSKQYDFSQMETNHRKDQSLPISTPELSKLYNLPVGFELLRDCGWQIPAYLAERSIPFKTLVHEKPTVNAQIIKTGHNYHEEYHLDGKPFLAHQRGSMKHRFRLDKLSRTFYDACDSYFANG